MRNLLVICAIFIPLMIESMHSNNLQDSYLWKNRVIILQFSIPNESMAASQRAILRSDSTGLQEREVIIIDYERAQKEGIIPLGLQQPLSDSGFRILLRGKDGGIKWVKDRMVTSEELYAIIDAMPMRKSEMRQQAPDHR